MSKVSVIIPAYNASTFIRETVQSVIMQDFKDWELIIINDGSTDNTKSILDKFSGNEKVQVFHIANGGVSNARNVGYKKSKGKYFAFLDADDVWLESNLSAKVAFLNQHKEVGLVHSDAEVIDNNSSQTGETKSGKSGSLLRDLLLWNGTSIPAPSSILVRREVIDCVEGFNTNLSTAADQEFFFRVANKFEIGRIPKVTWQYRIHEMNMHHDIKHMEEDHIQAYHLANQNGLFESTLFKRKCFSNLYFILAGSWWVNQNKHPRTWLLLWKSFWQNPLTLPRIIQKLF